MSVDVTRLLLQLRCRRRPVCTCVHCPTDAQIIASLDVLLICDVSRSEFIAGPTWQIATRCRVFQLLSVDAIVQYNSQSSDEMLVMIYF